MLKSLHSAQNDNSFEELEKAKHVKRPMTQSQFAVAVVATVAVSSLLGAVIRHFSKVGSITHLTRDSADALLWFLALGVMVFLLRRTELSKPIRICMLVFIFFRAVGCILDLTDEIPALVSTPIIGADGIFRDEIRTLFGLIIVTSFVLVWYFASRDTDRLRNQLAEKADRLELEIKERIRVENLLRDFGKQFQTIAETAPSALAITRTEDGTILYANPQLGRLFGISAETIIGRKELDFYVNSNDRTALVKQFQNHGLVRNQEILLKRSDGTPLWASISIKAITYQNEQCLFLSVEDITERKRTNDLIQQLTLDLQHASRLSVMGEMAAGVAHELHQPLAVIANYANGCKLRMNDREIDPKDSLAAMEAIVSETMRAGTIVRHIKDFVQKREPVRTLMDINDVVHHAMQLAIPNLNKYGIKPELALANDLPKVRIDSIQITQVLLNLILNAVDALQPMGKSSRILNIQTGIDDQDRVRVAVTDSGHGVLPEEQEKIFDQFFTNKKSGLGLGLSISRSIIANCGGRLWCESEIGKGSIFQFTLPIGFHQLNIRPFSMSQSEKLDAISMKKE